ncbi:hypothetical protein WN990_10325 [Kitasatospora purpeofusca]|uniref:hypothetical protein n=1 Tax=Kitasatospora purpeofusca TaxID=67352 RepID=UPI0030F21EE0
MRTPLRITTAALVVATALTAAAPLATAAQAPRTAPPTAAAVRSETVELTPSELAEIERLAEEIRNDVAEENRPSAGHVTAFGGKGDVGKKLIALLKKSPALLKSAVSKAKEGKDAFEKWMAGQNKAVRAAWWLAGGAAQSWVIDELSKIAD